WLYEFLTKIVGIPAERLWVTCFEGDKKLQLPKDTESAQIWKEIGIPEERILFYGADKNWWSRAGTPQQMPAGEPGGPDSEVFYDFDPSGKMHDPKYGKECHPNCECGRFMEIGNSVFMEYMKQEDGTFGKLPVRSVDFGGGLERITAASNNNADVFLVDSFQLIIRELAAGSGKNYNDPEHLASFRIVADHLRAAIFILGDGVHPSNTDRGYVLRRLVRRAVRHMDKLGIKEGTVERVVESVIASYKDQYPELSSSHGAILSGIRDEEERFRKTLSQGMRKFEKAISKVHPKVGHPMSDFGVEVAFELFTTYGFPIELTIELAAEKGYTINRTDVEKRMAEHQSVSRRGATQKFAGGLADHSEQTIRYHTAHHLLLKALQEVIGSEVKQRGSNITAERLRIDFSYSGKMTPEQIAKVEKLVNEKITQSLPVIRTVIPKEEAEKLGAQHEFGVKYPETVSVYSVGPKGATSENPRFSEAFSIEFCGGPHVGNTEEIGTAGLFKIVKEEAVASGIRRIKAVLEK
ncbi:MAG: alanine--tRNA ligase-related protein, partial [bacterium]|nr:alanine--tRNA ligase-related protein [bacterium]